MREDSPAPAPAPVHSFHFQTDAPHLTRISHHPLGDLKFEIIDAMISDGGFTPATLRTLAALLRSVTEEDWGATGRLACELSVPELQEAAGLGRSAIFKITKQLVVAGLIRKQPGTGHRRTYFEVLQSTSLRAPGARKLVDPRRAQACNPQARAAEATPSNRVLLAASIPAAAAPVGGEESTAVDCRTPEEVAAAAAGIEKWELGEQPSAELLALATTTPLNVLAAGNEVRFRKPPSDNPQGLFIWLLHNPTKIGQKALKRAAAELAPKPPPQTTPAPAPTPPPAVVDPDWIARARAAVQEQMREASNGTL